MMNTSSSSSIVISIPNDNIREEIKQEEKITIRRKIQHSLASFFHSLIPSREHNRCDARQLLHSIKVGIALVLVSLLYLVDPLYDQVGENAMWAIMTVVVLFEFYAGATLSKGLNRGMGTILGGGLGCLAASLAQAVGSIGKAMAVGTSVFIFGAAGTYWRMVPSIKKKYDYGIMIFILTFNLVVVSGLRGEEVMALARERLSTIVMGFAVSMLTSLLVFPVWASDELHRSTFTKFHSLAVSIEGCVEEYFKISNDKNHGNNDKETNNTTNSVDSCKTLLNSKSKDEMLANFARWEPWHGKFGFYHPWDKYLCIAELLRELATSILSLKACLQPSLQPSLTSHKLSTREPCEAAASILACTLREFGDSIMNMRKSRPRALIVSKVQIMKVELSGTMSASTSSLGPQDENRSNGVFIASTFVFLLMEMMDKVEELAKEVEELGDLAGFLPHQ